MRWERSFVPIRCNTISSSPSSKPVPRIQRRAGTPGCSTVVRSSVCASSRRRCSRRWSRRSRQRWSSRSSNSSPTRGPTSRCVRSGRYCIAVRRPLGRGSERSGDPSGGQRLYVLGSLHPPVGVPGQARPATEDDVELVLSWLQGFERDTGGTVATADTIRRRLRAGLIWIWEHRRPVAMATYTSAAAGVSRVGLVYTPPDHRRPAYAPPAPPRSPSPRSETAPSDACCTHNCRTRNPTPSTVASATSQSANTCATNSPDTPPSTEPGSKLTPRRQPNSTGNEDMPLRVPRRGRDDVVRWSRSVSIAARWMSCGRWTIG
jgi:hypothetical protein